MNIRDIGKVILKFLIAIVTSIAIVSIATIIALNSRFVYKIMINKYNLVKETGVSAGNLIKDYNGLVNYLQNPFIESLKFDNFIMSSSGEIHFIEVKDIFINLIYISIIFILCIIIYLFFAKLLKNKNAISELVNNFNLSANILITSLVTLIILFIIDFSKVFIVFHKIFFKNNYWMFDPNTDPIINALPEELFMIYALIIISIVILFSVVIKMFYGRYKVKNNVGLNLNK